MSGPLVAMSHNLIEAAAWHRAMADEEGADSASHTKAARWCADIVSEIVSGKVDAMAVQSYGDLIADEREAPSIRDVEVTVTREIGFTFFPANAEEYLRRVFGLHYGSAED